MNTDNATPKPNSAESVSTAGLGAITFGKLKFVEAPSVGTAPPNYACDGCAFIRNRSYCDSAIEYKAKSAFGGDCAERNVIYVAAPNV